MNLPEAAPTRMLLDGQWTGGAGTFPVLNPSTGEPITHVPRASTDDVARAIDAAAQAQAEWAARPPRERAEVLRRAFELTVAHQDELALVMALEMGKTLKDAHSEAAYVGEFFRWFSEEAVRIGGELRRTPSGTNRILTFRKPIGVALLLTPWNFPAAMATRKIAPALAAGCSVVLKPVSDTPLTALLIAKLLQDAGAPPGVVNVLTTDKAGEFVTTALSDARVHKLSFTGSTGVGRTLLKQAADHVLNTSMELGGNGPFIVLEDAELDAAVEGAMLAKPRNGGQACTAANRFLVHQSVADEFAQRLAARMGALRIGPGTDPATELGPMINARAVDGIADKVDRSVAVGARAVIGAARLDRSGFFYPATVLTDVPRDSAMATEEIFGPVAPIIPVKDDEDAVKLANATEFGLTSYVYGSLARGLRVAERLEVGMVGLNRGLVSDPAALRGREGVRTGMRRRLRRHRRLPGNHLRGDRLVVVCSNNLVPASSCWPGL